MGGTLAKKKGAIAICSQPLRSNYGIGYTFTRFSHPGRNRITPGQIVLRLLMSSSSGVCLIRFVKNKLSGIRRILQNIKTTVFRFLNRMFVIQFSGLNKVFNMLWFNQYMHTSDNHLYTPVIEKPYF